MSELVAAPKGFLFISVIFHRDHFSESELTEWWTQKYLPGTILKTKFNPSLGYYAKEMGETDKLERFIYCSEALYEREEMVRAKIWATDFEIQNMKEGKRMVNVDVGLLNLENMILATGKNYSHRVYLGSGVFADLHYQYQSGRFEMFPWTYPDYQEPEKVLFFQEMRSKLLKWQKRP